MIIFCILGKTGAGKTTYLNKLVSNKAFRKEANLSLLVYGTTRAKREGELDGVDYYYYTEEEYEKIPKEDLIESRTYSTLNNGVVHYFTETQYFDREDRNIICAVSPEQFKYYKEWCDKENLKTPGKHIIYAIYLDTDLETRAMRVLCNRTKTDDDIYELCRRLLQEREEFKYLEQYLESRESKYYRFIIDNSKEAMVGYDIVLHKIKKFILNVLNTTRL